ncbi:hypothetical protein IJ670_06975 [bacterium]|nr:hypothetical protein [bacterium]
MPYFILFVVICAICMNSWVHSALGPAPAVIWADGIGFYSYLPATFIHHDWNMSFLNPHWSFCISDINQIVLRNSMGVSVMIFPFFITAHGLTLLMETHVPDGFSAFYQFFVLVSALTYCVLGLLLTYKTLISKFPKNIAILALTAITFGCGTFFYTTFHASYSHIYSFAMIALFVYLVAYEEKYKKRRWYYFILGLVLGLITLCRNVNILIGLFWLVWDVYSIESFKTRIKSLCSKKVLIPMFSGFFLVILPQMIYWKIQAGHFIVNTYTFQNVVCKNNPSMCFKEHFDWFTPHFIGNLFSHKKGLFYYYPVMVYALCGFVWLKKYFKEAFFATIAFLIPAVYIVVSWSEWWYGFSFGPRPYVDFMSIFAILIACCLKGIKDCENKIVWKIALAYFFLLIIISLAMMFLILTFHCNSHGSLILK